MVKAITTLALWSTLAGGVFLLGHEIWWSVKALGLGNTLPILGDPFSSTMTFWDWFFRNPLYWIPDAMLVLVPWFILASRSNSSTQGSGDDSSITHSGDDESGWDPEQALDDLMKICRPYMTEEGLGVVKNAFWYSEELHRGQKRKSGEPFIIHPVEAAKILAAWRRPPKVVAGSLLHDVVEDTCATVEDIAKSFGSPIARLVDAVTKVTPEQLSNVSQNPNDATIRKLIVASLLDPDAILIKLADRIHNTRTIGFLSRDTRTKKASETLSIFVHIADHLGMREVRRELADLSFQQTDPGQYKEIRQWLASRAEETEDHIEGVRASLQEWLKSEGINTEIEVHAKTPFSYIDKERDKRDPRVLRLRALIDDESGVNAAFGAICRWPQGTLEDHRDYVVRPKSNGYQSIHATLAVEDGCSVEFQLRTFGMHQVAEYGIVASIQDTDKIPYEQHRRAVEMLLEWQREYVISTSSGARLQADTA